MKKDFFPKRPEVYIQKYPDRCTIEIYEAAIAVHGRHLQHIPEQFRTRELCVKALLNYNPRGKKYSTHNRACEIKSSIPDDIKTYEFYKDVCGVCGNLLFLVPRKWLTVEICRMAFLASGFRPPIGNIPFREEFFELWEEMVVNNKHVYSYINTPTEKITALHKMVWEI